MSEVGVADAGVESSSVVRSQFLVYVGLVWFAFSGVLDHQWKEVGEGCSAVGSQPLSTTTNANAGDPLSPQSGVAKGGEECRAICACRVTLTGRAIGRRGVGERCEAQWRGDGYCN